MFLEFLKAEVAQAAEVLPGGGDCYRDLTVYSDSPHSPYVLPI